MRQGEAPTIFDKPEAVANRINSFTGQAKLYSGSLLDIDLIHEIIKINHIDTIIHLVSGLIPSSTESDFHRELHSVIKPTSNLFPIFIEYGCRLVYVSSGGSVYGSSSGSAFSEVAPPHPANYYAKSKMILEKLVSELSVISKLHHLILRPSNPYGRFQNPRGPQGFITVAAWKLLRGEPLTIWGDGTVIRDYIHVNDLSESIISLLNASFSSGIYNIGSGEGHSLLDVVEMLEQLTGMKLNVNYSAGRSCDPAIITLDITKIKSVIEFKPLNLRDGLKLYLEELRDNG
jgi:UDP-glucose 4-epimerase